MVEYRGHTGKLFKRDFAGEMIYRFDLKLIDYGFLPPRQLFFIWRFQLVFLEK